MPRPKGSKNKVEKRTTTRKVFPIRLEKDLTEWVESHGNKNAYFNYIIRKDMEQAIGRGEFNPVVLTNEVKEG